MADFETNMRLAMWFSIEVTHLAWCLNTTPYPVDYVSLTPMPDEQKWKPIVRLDRTGRTYAPEQREEIRRLRIAYLLEQVHHIYFTEQWWLKRWIWDDFQEANLLLSEIEYQNAFGKELVEWLKEEPDTES